MHMVRSPAQIGDKMLEVMVAQGLVDSAVAAEAAKRFFSQAIA